MQISFRMLSSITVSLILLFGQAHAFEQVVKGPIHEALVQRIAAAIAGDAIELEPPHPLHEVAPPSPDPTLVWVHGYWAWFAERNDFVWVSGLWRRPPPGHRWIDGYWSLLDDSWVWVKGFWSINGTDFLTYLDTAPPDGVEEDVQSPENDDYFWQPGYWIYSEQAGSYQWVPGQWALMDPNWIFVPTHYLWTPKGYLFIPAYWDWLLEVRGDCYSTIWVEPIDRHTLIYTPVVICDHGAVVEVLFVDYPDHICFFHHHHHYHHDYWTGCGCAPPWWEWGTWWTYTWHDQWSLCWWYTHPGYPQPMWMSANMASHIHAPSQNILKAFKGAHGPHIITPNGVVAPSVLRNALLKAGDVTKDKKLPVFPANPNLVKKIQLDVQPKSPKQILKPSGRPSFGSKKIDPIKKPKISWQGDVKIQGATISPELLKGPKKPNMHPISPKPIEKGQQIRQDHKQEQQKMQQDKLNLLQKQKDKVQQIRQDHKQQHLDIYQNQKQEQQQMQQDKQQHLQRQVDKGQQIHQDHKQQQLDIYQNQKQEQQQMQQDKQQQLQRQVDKGQQIRQDRKQQQMQQDKVSK